MNKIIVEISVGELLDKISILEIKQSKIKNLEKLKFINNEHSILKSQLEKNIKSDTLHSNALFSIYKPTYSFSKFKLFSFVERIFYTIFFLLKYDIFLYHAGSSLFTIKLNLIDVRLAKFFKKKVKMI